MVPTVDLGFREPVFCSIDMAGDKPSIVSTSGFSIKSKNCLAYAESDSTYRLCPSAYIVSNANEDLPEPDGPVITTNLFFSISTLISLRLCCLAPLINSLFFIFFIIFIKKLNA